MSKERKHDEKQCTKCGSSGPFREAIGRGGTKSICRPCESEYGKQRAKYKRAVINRYKQIRGCQNCGVTDYRCLTLDHREPSLKSFTVGLSASNKGLRTIAKEIAKCDVLCANCHSIKTYENGDRQHRRKDK